MDIVFPSKHAAREIISESERTLDGKPITTEHAIELLDMELFICQLKTMKSPWGQQTAEGTLIIRRH